MAETDLTSRIKHYDPRLIAFAGRAWQWLHGARRMRNGTETTEKFYRSALRAVGNLTPPIKPASFLAFDLHGDDGDAA